jgi:hypothetical protein
VPEIIVEVRVNWFRHPQKKNNEATKIFYEKPMNRPRYLNIYVVFHPSLFHDNMAKA